MARKWHPRWRTAPYTAAEYARARAFLKAVGAALRHFRKGRGLTQAQLAKAVGMSRSRYSRIERGEGAATLHDVERLARVLRVSGHELFEEAAKRRGRR